jgi:glycosidase
MKSLPRLRFCVRAFLVLALVAPFLRAGEDKDFSRESARPVPAWVRDTVIYEVFPRQFSATGDFAGITARLDELKALGVDVIWLMPIHPIGKLKAKGSIGSPYAVQDYYAVNPDYGTKEDFRRLVDAAHERGLKVIIDIVANHTAWDSVLMAKPQLYRHDAAGNVISPHDWWDVAGLDYANPETRRYMADMLQYWLREFKLDGFRCDVAGEVPTDFWEEVRPALEQIRPGLLMLAEASKPDLMTRAFDADYAWPFHAALNRVLMQGAPASELPRSWRDEERGKFPRGTLHMRMSDNHDEPRAISRFGWPAALAASALMFTLDGVPLLYNGMEVGDTSESGDPALFEKLPIYWQPKQRTHFRETYRHLIALRRAHPAFRTDEVGWLKNSAPDHVVAYLRRDAQEEFAVVINFSNRPQWADIIVENAAGFEPVLRPGQQPGSVPAGLGQVALDAFEWRIYRRAVRP